MRKRVSTLAAVLFSTLIAPALFAQTTGTIRGVVETGQTALPGVTVEAKSPNLQGSRTAVTDSAGRFALAALPPGSYTINATMEGFAPKTEVLQLGLDQAAVLRIELLPAQAEKVTVTAEVAQVETESNTVGRNLDAKVFQALPTGRNYASVAQLASGVNTDASDLRNPAITVYGSTGLENSYLVDGANTTGAEIGNQGKVLNFEFIQEVEVKSGGYEAEYGGAQGGILNVVTKSGGNEFHGDAFGYFDNDALQADNKHLNELTSEGIQTGFRKSDFGADVGGYLIKDKLWFFGAYDHVSNTLDRQVTQGPEVGVIATTDSTGNLYSGKLTYKISDRHTLIGTVFGDPTDDTGAVAAVLGPPSTYDGTVTVGGTDFGGRYEGMLSPKVLITGQFSYHRENVDRLPGPNGDQIAFQDFTSGVELDSGGWRGVEGTGQLDTKRFTRYDYRLEGNYFLGSHDAKVGFQFERVNANVTRNYSGGQLVQINSPYEDDPLQRNVYFHSFFADPASTIDNPVIAPVVATPQNDVISAFVQDRWSVLRNLTVNAGVRYERELVRGLNNFTYLDMDHVSPRVGFTWDFLNDGRGKLYGSYSHFVQIIPLDMNIRSLNGERDGATYNFDPTNLACDPAAERPDLGASCVIRGKLADAVDPNIRSPYQDEIIVGIERQVGNTWSFGLRGIYRSLRRVVEDTCVPPDTCENYSFINPGFSTEGCLEGECLPVFPFRPARRYFRGIELNAQKRLSDRWMLYASYLYSSLKGNYDGSFRAIGGFFARNPNITDDFDYPDFQVNAYGKLTLDRPHQLKLQAAYVAPFGVTLSVSGFYQSGTPLSRIGWWDNYGGPELFITPRGSEGRSPATYEVDAHLDYGLPIGPVTVHVLADLFNALNRQEATDIDQVWAFSQSDNASPTPTNAHYGLPNSFQQPRTLRLGLRVSF
jgi:Carboxypeptidase regulatory-like domain/TonB-dependent Receptor Plug Domain